MRASKKLGVMRSSEAAKRGPRAAEICRVRVRERCWWGLSVCVYVCGRSLDKVLCDRRARELTCCRGRDGLGFSGPRVRVLSHEQVERGEGEEEEEEEEEEEKGPVQGASETFCDARKLSTRGEEGGEARRMLHRIETLAPPSLTTTEHKASRIAYRERTATVMRLPQHYRN